MLRGTQRHREGGYLHCGRYVLTTGHVKGLVYSFETIGVKRNRISTVIWNVVSSVLSVYIVVKHKEISNEIPVIDFVQLFCIARRIS